MWTCQGCDTHLPAETLEVPPVAPSALLSLCEHSPRPSELLDDTAAHSMAGLALAAELLGGPRCPSSAHRVFRR